MHVVGVDWAGQGWVCVVLDASGVLVTTEHAFADVVARFGDTAAIAVDIPIGLPTGVPSRRADEEAGRLVPRSTVFATYPREVYQRPSHAEAVALCRLRGWPGISRQSYGLWQRMHEVETYADRVHEVHPEISFWKMNGERRLTASKHTWNGLFERRGLLEREGIAFPDSLAENARAVDVLDAGAAAWSARRIARGEHETLPRQAHPVEPVIFY
jgi:predicted RNase H-like nuclease